MPLRLRQRSSLLFSRLACVLLLCATPSAQAAPDLSQPPLSMIANQLPVAEQPVVAPIRAIFRIEKSENRNQVYYGAHVDEACRPMGPTPIYAYWRMFERGPTITEGLLDREQAGYGLLPQQLVSRAAHGGSVRIRLRAWPDRPVRIELFPHNTGCGARATLNIQHQPAVIQSIYIDIGFLFSVNYALVRGLRIKDGKPIQEKLSR